jgi:hypothetical protein
MKSPTMPHTAQGSQVCERTVCRLVIKAYEKHAIFTMKNGEQLEEYTNHIYFLV